MAKRNINESLESFATIDLGELYYIGDRTFVERGLRCFKQYSVESLVWDEESKKIVSVVSGSRSSPYEVWLQVCDGRLKHECDCPSWETYGACKHAVAAAAAMYMAVQGLEVGGIRMPDDYVEELREGLHIGPEGELPQAPEETLDARPKAVLKVLELSAYGGMRLKIVGPVPHEFMRQVGVNLLNDYGYGGSREFFLGDLDDRLKPFLAEAEEAGIVVRVPTPEGEADLQMADKPCRMALEFDIDGRKVVQRYVFKDADGEVLEAVELFADDHFILLSDGTVHVVETEVDGGPSMREGSLSRRHEAEAFNRAGTMLALPEGAALKENVTFKKAGKALKPKFCGLEQVGLELDCAIVKNAANEPELLEFAFSAKVGDVSVNLPHLGRICLDPILSAYSGGLLSSKRRVRALTDLVRRFLADYEVDEELELAIYQNDFPELYVADYRNTVCGILRALAVLLAENESGKHALAADVWGGRYHIYTLELRKIAMLFYSMAAVDTRRGLHELDEGGILIRRGSSGSEVLQRLLAAATALGVTVRVDEMPVRRETLSISVDAKTAGTDINWFALHPTIACGERTISPDEWQNLIRGELMLQGEDGALILPEIAEGAEAGLKVLASMFRDETTRRGNGAAALTQVSRLEILDWISLRQHGIQVALPKEADALFESLMQFRKIPEFKIPKGLKAELRPYQVEGSAWIDFLYQHRFGACLADDMGLGKTVQAITFILTRFEQGLDTSNGAPVLIVLPPSLVFNWLDEWQRFAPSIKVVDCIKKADWPAALSNAQVVLTTYDRVRLDLKELQEHCFEVVVFDEAHNLKSVTAARTKAAAQLDRRFTLCLTGTPVENNASEFYSVLSAAVPGIFGTHQSFKEAFRKTPDRILGRSRPFILRRTKAKILKELPKKEEHALYLEMTPLQKEIYTRTVSEVRDEIAEAYADRPEQQAGIVALAAILRLRQVCVSPALLGKEMPEPAPKFAYMADKLEELQAEGHAALVFSQFLGALDQMEAVARERGIDYLRMDGRTPIAGRKNIVRSFQSGKGPSFFFISLKTGGVGLNLTQANYVFHLDPWWNPAVENQASDRAHRIGQKRSVFVQRLIMQHSIEARIMELKARKAELFRQLVEAPSAQTAKAGLSREDFDYLLNG